jgi:hypothetical protein
VESNSRALPPVYVVLAISTAGLTSNWGGARPDKQWGFPGPRLLASQARSSSLAYSFASSGRLTRE